MTEYVTYVADINCCPNGLSQDEFGDWILKQGARVGSRFPVGSSYGEPFFLLKEAIEQNKYVGFMADWGSWVTIQPPEEILTFIRLAYQDKPELIDDLTQKYSNLDPAGKYALVALES